MSIVEFSWTTALTGGLLIGLAAVTMMGTIGKIAGISGIFSSVLRPRSARSWQWAFVGGLFLSGLMIHWLYAPISIDLAANTPTLIIAGLLVGFGTRLGNGCTSGHGVCGISRFSPRSLTATAVFMGIGMLTVFVMSHMGQGA